MYRRPSSIVVLLVLSLCTAGAASALPLDPEAAEAPGGVLRDAWEKLLEWMGRLTAGDDDPTILEMEGCHIDPNGICGGH